MIRPALRDSLLWLDLETTGSNEIKGDCIIEIGCILTTHDLQVIDSFTSLVKPDPLGLGRLFQNQIVREMHQKNGLLDEVLSIEGDELLPHKVADRLIKWLAEYALLGQIAIAGSGVGHFDTRFLRKYMPVLANACRYWTIDIGSVRRAHDMWVGTSVSNANDLKTHRALDDATCHLEEARAFKELWNR